MKHFNHQVNVPSTYTGQCMIAGIIHCYEDGMLHNNDGPAIKSFTGHKEWWFNGKRHRLNGPAIITSFGLEKFYIEGKEFTKQDYLNDNRTQNYKLTQILTLD